MWRSLYVGFLWDCFALTSGFLTIIVMVLLILFLAFIAFIVLILVLVLVLGDTFQRGV